MADGAIRMDPVMMDPATIDPLRIDPGSWSDFTAKHVNAYRVADLAQEKWDLFDGGASYPNLAGSAIARIKSK